MRTTDRGFTLVELIIVIAVIGVLAAILIPVFSNAVRKANNAAIFHEARNIYTEFAAEKDFPKKELPVNGWIAVSYNGRMYYVEMRDGELQITDVISEDASGKTIIAWNEHTEHFYHNGMCPCGALSSDAVTSLSVSDYEYHESFGHTVVLTKYIGASDTVTVPDAYIIDGNAYRPVLDSLSVFSGNTVIRSVKLHGAEYLNNSMQSLFNSCTSLSSVDFSDADTSAVTNMRSLFYGCTGLRTIDLTGLDTGSTEILRSFFSGCSNLESADISMLDTSNALSLELFFYNCSNLTSVNLSGIDTSKVTTVKNMFRGCSTLPAIDFTGFDTSRVRDMECMFYQCTALTTLDLSPFDTSNVTTMLGMFYNCTHLKSVDLSSFNTSRVTDMQWMFYGCGALRALDLSGFDTGNVTYMKAMFYGCKKLTGLSGIENWDTHSLQTMNFMFCDIGNASGVGEIERIDMRSWDLSHIINNGWCFQNCRAKQILLPDNLAVISAGFLNHANRITGSAYTIPAGVKKIGYAHTIYDFATNDFTDFIVADGNTNYKTIDGILYSADGSEMLAVPRAKTFEDGVYELPEGITFLGELSFSRNQNIKTLVLPDSYEIEYIELNDPRYIIVDDTGNINDGNNLKIAIYMYCNNLSEYVVKDTNPRYASKDGIIYSKDMTQLVEIPTRYKGMIEIPEGVQSWNRGAYIFAEKTDSEIKSFAKTATTGCTGVSIPSSLETIDDLDFRLINIMYSTRKGTSNPFTITVAEGNTAFYIGADGSLCRR